ncbi:hypothetical protein [Actinoplanes sp. NPDC020271]|uniref:hypothetical protein n=1 Tax=Actinoplanes sp. NPDC020271 TaxID=3363896 RepID=UPI0037880080
MSTPTTTTAPATAVATLARMRWTMLRRALRENPAPMAAAPAGLLAAAWLIRYAVTGNRHTLGILAEAWVLGWIVLPLLLGGTRGRLRPTQLRLEPITTGPMTAGLLTSSAVGIGPAVSLIALAALPVHAAVTQGAGPAGVAAIGAVLLWLLGLTGSAVAVEAVGRAAGPVGAVLTGLFTGAVMGVSGSVWAVAPWIGSLLVTGPPAATIPALERLPGDWPLAAATGRGAATAGLLIALALLVGVGVVAYALLVRRAISAGAPFSPRRTLTADARAGAAPGPIRAVTVRELLSWVRHPLRLQYLTFAVVYGLLLGMLPLLAHVTLLAPWAGPLAVLWASAMAAGLVGLDGTALWIPLLSPLGERAEVRGRALAWLILAAPIGVVLTVAGILVAPGVDPLPALAVLPAVLAAGASTPVWVSLLRVRPVRDARHPTAADNPTDIVSVLLALAGPLVAAAPAFALAVWGPGGLRLLAPVAGVIVGAATGWGALWLADERVARRGTEILAAAGDRSAPAAPAVPLTWDAEWYRENKSTAWALVLLTVGWIPVLPQGLLVLVLDVHGAWIVAGHLSGGARTGAALGMVAFGAAMLLTGLVLWGRRPLEAGVGAAAARVDTETAPVAVTERD